VASPRSARPDGGSCGLADIAEICAAGGHHLSLLGRPRSVKAAVAGYLAAILPDLTADQASDLTAIRCAAGLIAPGEAPLSRPPLLAPHHTCSVQAMTGGGRPIRPGAAALACHGVLHLKDAPEFPRALLDTLRQPLEYGRLTLARADETVTFPARFILVIDASPCPCRSCEPCTCSQAQARRYLGRLAGPLLDRIDIKAKIAGTTAALARPSADIPAAAERVLAARERAAARLDGTGFFGELQEALASTGNRGHDGETRDLISQSRSRRTAATTPGTSSRTRSGSSPTAAADGSATRSLRSPCSPASSTRPDV
jgi:predicted ATPase with chaperone activity